MLTIINILRTKINIKKIGKNKNKNKKIEKNSNEIDYYIIYVYGYIIF